MVKNNFEMDIKVKLITASKTQEALGYDIELVYVSREGV